MLSLVITSFFAIAACNRSTGTTPTATPPTQPVESSTGNSLDANAGVKNDLPQAVSYSQFMNDPTRSNETVTKRYEGSNSISWDSKYCAMGVDCVNKVVNVYTSFGSCEGVLVAKDQVLTNRHCIEPVISQGQFSGLIAVMAPMKKARRDAIGPVGYVLNVRFLSPTKFEAEGLRPDFALLTLREPIKGVVPAKLNFEGIKNGETYFTYGHSPYGDAKEPRAIEKRTCKAVYNTTFSPNFAGPYFPVVKFADCVIGPGNSGSPIYNGEGELVALMGGQFSPQNTLQLSKLALLSLRNTKSPLTYIGWGTNLACMTVIFDSSKPIPSDCDVGFKSSMKQTKFSESFTEKLHSVFTSVPISDQRFRYKLARASETEKISGFITQALMLRVPDCIEPAALEALTSNTIVAEEIFYSSGILSKYWEITSETTPLLTLSMDINVDRQKLKSNGISALDIGIGPVSFYTGELKVCR